MNEGLKELEAVGIDFKHILRMPLDAPDETFPGHPGGFDEAVRGNGHHFQSGGQVLDRLVMEGIDGDFGLVGLQREHDGDSAGSADGNHPISYSRLW